jgi:hypothetical protein
MYYRGQLIANGVPASDGHAYSGQVFMTKPAYDALVAGTVGIDMTKVYVVADVLPAENVAEAEGAAPTAAEFKALLDALIAAGVMAAAPPAGG